MTQQQEELDQIKAKLQDHLISSGNYDIINKHLKLRLYESGWFDKVSLLASTELQENLANDKQMNFQELFSFIKPRAEEMVPEDIKDEVLEKLKDYLDEVIQ